MCTNHALRAAVLSVAAFLWLALLAPAAAGPLPQAPANLDPPLPDDAVAAQCAADAAGMVCRFQQVVHIPLEDHATCPDVTLQATGDAPGEFVWYYDQTGKRTHESVVFSWTGTISNLASGRSVPYEGQGMKTTDDATGIVSGTFYTRVPDGGIDAVSFDMGTVDPASGEYTADTSLGQEEYQTQLCEFLG